MLLRLTFPKLNCRYFFNEKRKITINNSHRQYSSSTRNHNHYDTLKLKPNCSSDDIRNSFVKLSKMYHPDAQGETHSKNTEEFTRIMEAYQVLSKKSSRLEYDQFLEGRRIANNTMANRKTSTPPIYESWRVNPDRDPNPSKNYYGFEGVKKISNLKIVFLLAIFAIVGTGIEIFLVRNSFTLSRTILDEESVKASKIHSNVRADAEKHGNSKQLEILAEKVLKKPK